MEVPIYLFTGFLESGKTKFIQDTLEDERFASGEKTLLIVCEEGEEEYNPEKSAEKNLVILNVDEEGVLTPQKFAAWDMKYAPRRVLVEYNGMWTLDKFYNALPENFLVYQEIFIADSTTVLSYNANMRQLVVDKLTSSEMVVFNRTGSDTDRMSLHKLVRGVSRKANICYFKVCVNDS